MAIRATPDRSNFAGTPYVASRPAGRKLATLANCRFRKTAKPRRSAFDAERLPCWNVSRANC